VENAAELREEWFADARSVGVCGATSTPRWLMDAVAARIAEIARGSQ
jgi:4-hydroxy-3-methylbut-2-enyl diphosphate reductase